jgi:predicted XRE-type DNA-binding protein
MATLKEFEDTLREHGMHMALALLQKLRERDRDRRSTAPARRVTGRKMTPDLARTILDLHATTSMTQQEIAFKLGVNQGRVNEVIKHGKWLTADPDALEAVARDKALARARGLPVQASGRKPGRAGAGKAQRTGAQGKKGGAGKPAQLSFGEI